MESPSECPHRVGRVEVLAEVQERRKPDRLVDQAERQREAGGVLQHQDAVVVAAGRRGVEAEVGLVEAARALLVAYGDREMIHSGTV